MVPVTEALFAAAGLQPGQTVLDVGCGTGPTTGRAAGAVRPGGRAVGTDVAAAMIETARAASAAHPALPQPEWLVADAETHDFGAGTYDAVISRFGVMFFADPEAAFANLWRATAPGGRLVAAVWQTRDRVPLFDLPYRAATRVLDELGLAYEPVAPDDSQCSLGSDERVRAVLAPAGWREITTRPTDRRLHVGGRLTAAEAAQDALDIGPIRGVLEGRPEEIRERVREALTREFERRHDGTGVVVDGGFMIVTARR